MLRVVLALLVLVPVVVYCCNKRIMDATEGLLYSDVNQVPCNKTGLLLGTGKFLVSGAVNPYYAYRIEAATQLMKAGKIKYLVISGDNSRADYDEPSMMRADLMQAGIDSSRIYLDYAGFRTFDSMVRFREIFGQQSGTIISQPFHNERALFIASCEGIHAIAFNAQDVNRQAGIRVQLREKLARVKVFADYLLQTQPKFLGPQVVIPD